MKPHDFRAQDKLGRWRNSDSCRYCDLHYEEISADDLCEETAIDPDFAYLPLPPPKSGTFSVLSGDRKINAVYFAEDHSLDFVSSSYHRETIASYSLGRTKADMHSRGTPGRAAANVAGGALAGSLIFPGVGTVIGAIAGGAGKSRKATISLTGDVNLLLECDNEEEAFHLCNLINHGSFS